MGPVDVPEIGVGPSLGIIIGVLAVAVVASTLRTRGDTTAS